VSAIEALATAGAFGCFDLERREALWSAGPTSQSSCERLEGVVTGVDAPRLPGMSPAEVTAADLWSTSVSPESHPIEHARGALTGRGAISVKALASVEHGARVLVGGVVTHRQRPSTAQGIVFVNLEDETGMLNVVCSPGLWARYRRVARASPALLVRGTLERVEGATNLVADRIEPLSLSSATPKARDFR
jgi:error-prone DNA polymerase